MGVALLAVEQVPKMSAAAFFGQHPGSIGERRLMADMLAMAAGQVGHPVPLLVLMKAGDRLLHVTKARAVRARWDRHSHAWI